jgi:hypothetical protein
MAGQGVAGKGKEGKARHSGLKQKPGDLPRRQWATMASEHDGGLRTVNARGLRPAPADVLSSAPVYGPVLTLAMLISDLPLLVLPDTRRMRATP